MHRHVLDPIVEAFAASRPDRFERHPSHCKECFDHEATLSRVTLDTISLAEVGNPAWDPICFVTHEDFCYLVPGLSRLALGTGDQYYLREFLCHLESGRVEAFNAAQKVAVTRFLEYLAFDFMPSEIDGNDDDEALGRVLEKLTVQDDHEG